MLIQYFEKRGVEKGLEQGIERGLRQAHLDDARRMHAEGFGWDVISLVTGINREDLNLER